MTEFSRLRRWWRRWFMPTRLCWWCARDNHKHNDGRCVVRACQCEVTR